MKLPRYPKYKDSGVKWLEQVPEHWEVRRLKRVLAEPLMYGANESADDDTPGNPRYVRITDIDSSGELREDTFKSLPKNIAKQYLLQGGDILLARSGATVGKSFMYLDSWGECCFAGYLIRVRLKKQSALPAFVYSYFQSSIYWEFISSEQIQATIQNVSAERYATLPICFPPFSEQLKMEQFLADQVGKINALIREQQNLIELLQEKRQAIISQAVTKGLNPNAAMKSSGVKWVGEVPAHWDVFRLASLYREIIEAGNDELPILSVSIHDGVSDRQLAEDEMERKVNRSEDVAKYKRVLPGDLVYNMMRAWQGGFGTVTVPGQISPAYVVARPKRDFSSRFIELLLRTRQAIEEIRCHSYGVTDFRLRLYWDNFKIIRVVLPPKNEQVEILARIEKMNQKFDQLIDASKSSIARLQERRSALITAAVTGQIDVRNYRPEEAAAVCQ
jgi:type I restriction enzyme S subunit